MSKELLNKHTAGVLGAVIKQPHWQKDELTSRLKQVLDEMRHNAGSQDAYLESLLKNVTFLFENTNRALSLLKVCVEEEKFMTQENFQQAMLEVPKLVNETNFFVENMPRFKDLVYKGSTLEEQEAHGELVYCDIRLVNDMVIDFIGTFLHPNNKDFMINLMEYASDVVVETVMQYCKTYSGLMLKEINTMK
ncbi:hypothetical protein MLOOGBEN_17560 [Bacillus sp. EB106-08-02-XG196]|uniref:hypothetical protein n=1 Tax=Bacillus sp. EB106-08-02-XG196 TaxID=2737049 RepID=UPI0015C4ACFC|nr:hypothetical protein [Bacillus sp. EB106-08-02-XG196]NWQ42512.1 hypothetical protein [Bacillus sp. EB106-08-02-XG196]